MLSLNTWRGNADIKGFSLCKQGSKLTHLFFVDDNLLFCNSIIEDCNDVLKYWENMNLGQGKRSTKTRPQSSLASPPRMKLNQT